MYLHFSIIGFAFICYVLAKVTRNQFSEGKSIFWVMGGILMLVLSLFPILFTKLSHLLGVVYPPSLLFLFGILFVVFVTFRQEEEISLLDERVKELAQRNALLEQALSAYLKQDNTQEDGK
jgi:hypothetical protein